MRRFNKKLTIYTNNELLRVTKTKISSAAAAAANKTKFAPINR